MNHNASDTSDREKKAVLDQASISSTSDDTSLSHSLCAYLTNQIYQTLINSINASGYDS